jgi:hypothetical protein
MKISTSKALAITSAVILSSGALALAQVTSSGVTTSGAASTGQVTEGVKSLGGLIDIFTGSVVKALATLFLSLGVVAFFFGVVQYIWAKREGDSSKMKVSGEFMTWSLVALFVMFSVYGIIKFSQSILLKGFDTKTIEIPDIQFKGAGSPTANPFGGAPAQSGVPSTANPPGGAPRQVGTGSSVYTSTDPLQRCLEDGKSRALCECEAKGGAWNLTDQTCFIASSGTTNTTTSGAASSNTTALQQCIANGGDKATCECEAKGGAMGTDGVCSVSSTGTATNNCTGLKSCSVDASNKCISSGDVCNKGDGMFCINKNTCK